MRSLRSVPISVNSCEYCQKWSWIYLICTYSSLKSLMWAKVSRGRDVIESLSRYLKWRNARGNITRNSCKKCSTRSTRKNYWCGCRSDAIVHIGIRLSGLLEFAWSILYGRRPVKTHKFTVVLMIAILSRGFIVISVRFDSPNRKILVRLGWVRSFTSTIVRSSGVHCHVTSNRPRSRPIVMTITRLHV